MTGQLKVSSIIIAKNEEYNIPKCIESQLLCIDEIIVLIDVTTTDNTIEKVKAFPSIKYEIVEWQGYTKTKEYAISLTHNEWILWVDADEILTSELVQEINYFKTQVPRYSAYSVARRAYFLGKWIRHSGWYPGRVIRLFNKNKAKFVNKDVHEHLEIDGQVGELKNDLNHFTDPSIKHYFNKFNRYTTLAANELDKNGKGFSLSDIILRPAVIFIKMYFIKLGFLDGIQGFILAVFSSAYVFTKYSKFWEIKMNKRRNSGEE